MPKASILKWDSQFFGKKIASSAGFSLKDWDFCFTKNVDCLYSLVSPDKLTDVERLFGSRSKLVDVRVKLQRETVHGRIVGGQPGLATGRHFPALGPIAMVSHESSRFFRDPQLREKAPGLFVEWISKSLDSKDKTVLLAKHQGSPAGYSVVGMPRDDEARIELIAVAEDARGRGLGTNLVLGSVNVAKAAGALSISVVTQASNLAAMSFYQKLGFKVVEVGLWFHTWFRKD